MPQPGPKRQSKVDKFLQAQRFRKPSAKYSIHLSAEDTAKMSGFDGKPLCSDIIAFDQCPFKASTGCHIPGNRVRVLQHGHLNTNLNADWAPSQRHNAAFASILDLPREIRDAIYEYLIPSDQCFGLGSFQVDFDQKFSHVHPRNTHIAPASWTALLRVSKQLHHEVAARFYGANAFSVSCAVPPADLHRFAARAITAFGFAGLVPMHPAYLRFLRGIEIRSLFDDSPDGIQDLFHTSPTATFLSSGQIHYDPRLPPVASEESIRRFIESTQVAVNNMTPCSCLRLIPLGNGIYTLRRPPGPARTRCKSATWRDVQSSCGLEFERMRRGEFRGLRNRRRGGGCAPLPMWFCGLILCGACLTCCAPLWWNLLDKWWAEKRKKRRRERGGGDV